MNRQGRPCRPHRSAKKQQLTSRLSSLLPSSRSRNAVIASSKIKVPQNNSGFKRLCTNLTALSSQVSNRVPSGEHTRLACNASPARTDCGPRSRTFATFLSSDLRPPTSGLCRLTPSARSRCPVVLSSCSPLRRKTLAGELLHSLV